ncbi:MAG: hypothetical protein ABJA87_13680 [bacterium]
MTVSLTLGARPAPAHSPGQADRSEEGSSHARCLIIGAIEPGGAQLSALRLSSALDAYGMHSAPLVAGDATPDGLALAAQHGISVDAFRVAETIPQATSLQWTPSRSFARWLVPRLDDAAGLVGS